MSAPSGAVVPSEGICVLHLFCHLTHETDASAVQDAEKHLVNEGGQLVTAAIVGHKADVGFVALCPDMRPLWAFQRACASAGLAASSSYVSLTELSEYAAGLPEEMRQARLYPRLPPEGMPAFCFYPMSKRRSESHNWYALDFEERKRLMLGHGLVGRNYRGRIVQLITGSTGLDDWEWGVTLFGRRPDDLKACVYEMRFDEASALYADFGPFYTGMVGELGAVLEAGAPR